MSRGLVKLSEIIDAEGDTRQVMLSKIGDLSDVQVLHSQVLVSVHPGTKYHQNTKILRTDNDVMEQRFQGTAFLVLKLGPGAFKDDHIAKFHGLSLKEGDWVLARPSDGLELMIREVPCRLFDDVKIRMKVGDPLIFW